MATEEPLNHRQLAVSLFNRTWELLDQPTRSHEERAEMLTVAFASRHHWREAGEARNFAISDWQISRAAAVLGYADLAEEYGQRSLEIASGAHLGPFYEGYAHEALARAAGLAGNRDLKAKHLDIAYTMLDQIDEASEREMLGPDLDELRR